MSPGGRAVRNAIWLMERRAKPPRSKRKKNQNSKTITGNEKLDFWRLGIDRRARVCFGCSELLPGGGFVEPLGQNKFGGRKKWSVLIK